MLAPTARRSEQAVLIRKLSEGFLGASDLRLRRVGIIGRAELNRVAECVIADAVSGLLRSFQEPPLRRRRDVLSAYEERRFDTKTLSRIWIH